MICSLSRQALAAALLATTLGVAAENRMYVKDFAINAGETKMIEVYMENDEPVRAIEFLLSLPEGLTADAESAAYVAGRASQEHSLIGRLTSKGYRILGFSTQNTTYAGTDGPIIELPVTAADDFAESGTLRLDEIIIEADSGEALVDRASARSMVFVDVPAPAAEN